MPAGPHFVTQPILLSETFLIFDINHQQTQGEVDQIETINDNVTTRPITWKVLPMAQLYLKKVFDHAKDLDCELFYSELKRHNVSVITEDIIEADNIHYRVRKTTTPC